MFKALHATYEGTKAALQSIRAHALRSALTTLGIIIGVAAVITVVAIMQGLSRGISSQLDDLGSDMITLRAYTSAEQQMLGVFNRLHHDDFLMLKARMKNVEDMTATMQAFSMGSQVQYGRNSAQTQIIGTDSSYQNVVRVYPDIGRFLSLSDDDHRRRVAFIGSSLIRKLDLPPNPVGEFINLSGDWFRIIGVAETRGSLFGFDQDNYIIAPFNTIRSLTGELAASNVEVMFRPAANTDPRQLQEQMRQLLRQRYRLQQEDADSFEFTSAERMVEQFSSITQSVTMVAGGVVSISLLVGGIGVMNIMLVSVTERTREIGIVKALGATPQFILLQFLVEALVLSLFGGVIGLILGYAIAAFIGLMMPAMPDALVPMWAIWLSIGFTTLIGVVFGLAPAIKASKLNPIEALRYE